MAQEAMTAAERIYEVFDTEPGDRRTGPAVPSTRAPRGQLRFEGVAFRYPDADRAGAARRRPRGDARARRVAIVGATGCGKTTLTALVPRLYDVTAGRITLDGHDIRDLHAAPRCADVVAVAFEEPTLFSMSVRENLTLGRPDATDEEIAEALEIAQAEFVHDLPWGLDTRIGEQGLSLSGGQRQRLALARAVLGRPRVLVLDDPLSALDVHTEALVEEALRRVLRDTTGIVVVHRAVHRRCSPTGWRCCSDGTIAASAPTHELHGERAGLPRAARPRTQERRPPRTRDLPHERRRTRRHRAPSGTWRRRRRRGPGRPAGQVSVLLRQRSRRLLGDLLRPHREGDRAARRVIVAVQNAAAHGRSPTWSRSGIDAGIPPMLDGHGRRPLLIVVVVAFVAGRGRRRPSPGARSCRWPGRIGQDILLDLRSRVFDHFQRLSLAFHERYTSGRVISRLTSDIDAIAELLDSGLRRPGHRRAVDGRHGGSCCSSSTCRWAWSRCCRSPLLLLFTGGSGGSSRDRLPAVPARPWRW